MWLKNVALCVPLLLTVVFVLATSPASCASTHNSRRDRHVALTSYRDTWPSWFKRRRESSRNERVASIGDDDARDTELYPTGHETLVAQAGTRVNPRSHPASRNARDRNENELVPMGTKKFHDFRENVSAKKRHDHAIGEMSEKNSVMRDSRNEATDYSESKTPRPTMTATTTTGVQDSSVDDKSEKLTALAVAEYAGTRAVAYAGYHHRNHDYNVPRNRDPLTPGYAIIATSATPIYTKHHSGRRVCSRPTSMAHHHRSRQYRLVYTELSASTFVCCPGWSQVSRTSYGCNRPTCAAPCLNGGVCGPHGKCNCPKAFTGTQCQTDVDECVTEKPCGQLCTNLPGSYECHCRYGFHLLPDGQSCRKNGSDGTAFEARDLENDYGYTTSTTPETIRRTTSVSHDIENEVGEKNSPQEYDIILRRLTKLEKQIARSRKRDTEATDMAEKISQAVESVAAMRRAVDNVQLMQQEIYDMRGKVKQYELESRKLQHLTNRVADLETRLRLRCRSSING